MDDRKPCAITNHDVVGANVWEIKGKITQFDSNMV